MRNIVGEGEIWDYPNTSGSLIPSGAVVVMASLIGIATTDIPSGSTGSVLVSGEVKLPKATGSGTALPIGTTVYWDNGNSRLTATSSGNTFAGRVSFPATTTDSTVRIRLAY